MHIVAETLDDVLREVIETLDRSGRRIIPGRGPATELTGVLLELSNPRARLSQTEDRGKLLSCLAELLWYLSKSDDLTFMEYYIPQYRNKVEVAEGNKVFGAYGPRLFELQGVDAFRTALTRLQVKPNSRRAVIVILSPLDLADKHDEIPCTCTLQFFLRDSALDMITTMRSNDAYTGLAHDFFAFTMLQEIAARTIGVDAGIYKHFVGSLHLYDANREGADQFLREGYQSTMSAMPPMPAGDPWPSIGLVLDAEKHLRERGAFDVEKYRDLDRYWVDLIRLLRSLPARRAKRIDEVRVIRDEMAFSGFRAYVDDQLYAMESSPANAGQKGNA